MAVPSHEDFRTPAEGGGGVAARERRAKAWDAGGGGGTESLGQ